MPNPKIRQKAFDEMSYDEMLTEIKNVKEHLKKRDLNHDERINLNKYLIRLNNEVYDYEEFRGILHTVDL